jgi:hypothetical protein
MPSKEKYCRITTLRDCMDQKSVFIGILRYWVAHSESLIHPLTSPIPPKLARQQKRFSYFAKSSIQHIGPHYQTGRTVLRRRPHPLQVGIMFGRFLRTRSEKSGISGPRGLERGFIEAALFRIRRPSSFERLAKRGSKEGKF